MFWMPHLAMIPKLRERLKATQDAEPDHDDGPLSPADDPHPEATAVEREWHVTEAGPDLSLPRFSGSITQLGHSFSLLEPPHTH